MFLDFSYLTLTNLLIFYSALFLGASQVKANNLEGFPLAMLKYMKCLLSPACYPTTTVLLLKASVSLFKILLMLKEENSGSALNAVLYSADSKEFGSCLDIETSLVLVVLVIPKKVRLWDRFSCKK